MPASLTPNQAATLDASSPQAIEEAFLQLLNRFRSRGWISRNNRYRVNTVKQLEDDYNSGSINHRELTEYIAASGPLHCMDGWSYLGRALSAHIHGDAGVARHLGYYAALRAAMSLLATEGIGIFSRYHYVVDDTTRQCIRMPGKNPTGTKGFQGTHEITWLTLNHWADSPRSTKVILDTVRPADVSLRDWLGPIATPSVLQRIGRDWLKTWGLDLKRLAVDHVARNEASYRPVGIRYVPVLGVPAGLDFLDHFWKVQQPFGAASFDVLDSYLLRRALQLSYKSSYKWHAKASPVNYPKVVADLMQDLGIDYINRNRLQPFLTWEKAKDEPLVLHQAGGKADTNKPQHPIQVISRAALLLRFATGACKKLIRGSNWDRVDLEFWWKDLGKDRGLWEPGNEPPDFIDLWSDVEDARNKMQTWAANTSPDPNHSRWQRDCSEELAVLTSCERIALWGLGID